MSRLTFRPAAPGDLAAIVALLADDQLGSRREVVSDPPAPGYLAAFEAICANPRELLAVAQDDDGRIVGTLQLTVLSGLSDQGADQALLRAVRIASSLRGQGQGGAFMAWAIDQARDRGCAVIELFTHNSRTDAHRFYERLGFVPSHLGMKLKL